MTGTVAGVVTIVDVDESTSRLAVVGASAVDTSRRSRLPGWTVGHVLAHLALNAEAFVRVASERRAGRVGVMYPNGVDGRVADIAARADLSPWGNQSRWRR